MHALSSHPKATKQSNSQRELKVRGAAGVLKASAETTGTFWQGPDRFCALISLISRPHRVIARRG
ncbi:hypothetical protein Deipe_0994 [Deinococcus peraridilitoris DSM 19664]|uniref:Uncharacterized protein n=1 Tax=Deinococcus peraridilitoris (strain DSM 19664 / LMG 22246 / CIP 109416 / KR-200) TaxID=937777 RepID=K9ZY16_DEIPD|nr:hypothetical protein Deipe_0994 [Deinococcus peraridilitoris DSM 19664]